MRQNIKMEAPISVRFFRIERGMRALVSRNHCHHPNTGIRIPPRMKRRMILQSTISLCPLMMIGGLTGPSVIVTTPLKGQQETGNTGKYQT
jgi:hypothetical protein